ncbi:hypothetical protein [Undibacterium sp. TJN19]|uniref:hypothetical protein n=1 Tax=Undibacterium sp. TJN19 TaxID=3413055 RepID=UPI003BF28A7C
MIRKTTSASMLALSLFSFHYLVMASPQAEEAQAVEISATKDPELKTYRQMLKGLDAFDQQHQLAPHAKLKFKLLPVKADITLDGVTLRIVSDETSINVPLDSEGRFVLPRDEKAEVDKADLVLNKKKGQFRWRPDIRTETVPADKRRLGDLRLECEIRWAVEYEEVPFVTRNLFRMAGGPCNSSHIAVHYWAGKKFTAAYLVEGERRLQIDKTPSGLQFIPPLHDKSWGNDALVEFDFAGATVDASPSTAPSK